MQTLPTSTTLAGRTTLPGRMVSLKKAQRLVVMLSLFGVSLLAVTGCKSKQDEAVDAAKQTAISTGQPQQVTSTDKDGNSIVSVVTPPTPGQTKASVVTTKTAPNGTVLERKSDGPSAPAVAPADNTAAVAPAPAPAPAESEPVIAPLDVTIPAGTTLPIRINQHISVKTAQAGDQFSGSFAESIHDDNGKVLIPRGTPVSGVISAAHRRGHFKGASILSLRLTTMTLGGKSYELATGRTTQTKKGKGKRSAGFIGGGAGLGMLVGGVATGGVGLLVGGLAGGGAGTLLAGTTGNRDIEIPAESIQRFRLAESLSVIPPH